MCFPRTRGHFLPARCALPQVCPWLQPAVPSCQEEAGRDPPWSVQQIALLSRNWYFRGAWAAMPCSSLSSSFHQESPVPRAPPIDALASIICSLLGSIICSLLPAPAGLRELLGRACDLPNPTPPSVTSSPARAAVGADKGPLCAPALCGRTLFSVSAACRSNRFAGGQGAGATERNPPPQTCTHPVNRT